MAEAGAGGDEGLSLVELADRDNPAEMAGAREWLAQESGEPVQRRRRTPDLDAVVAREIGGLGDGYVDPWAGGGAA